MCNKNVVQAFSVKINFEICPLNLLALKYSSGISDIEKIMKNHAHFVFR